MPKIAYINSKYIKFNEAKIHIEDRGLQFADSIYEVVATYKGNLVDFDFHIKRSITPSPTSTGATTAVPRERRSQMCLARIVDVGS